MSTQLVHPVDRAIDHVRGGDSAGNVVSIVSFGDFLCPYCRRFRVVLKRLRQVFGDRLAYTFRQFPNERSHPGAEFAARAAEAAANQGKFWEMHDRLYDCEPPLNEEHIRGIAKDLALDLERFERDLVSEEVANRVAGSLAAARENGVSVTPTLFVDGVRYDGAWDFYSMLDVLERPMALRIQRSVRAFANLPASGGLVLLLAAVAALVCANSSLAPSYASLIRAPFGIGPPGSLFALTIGEWFSEGLLAFFFLLVGLEIRREMTDGALSDIRAAALPAIASVGGAVVPALVYLGFNHGSTASGWSVPTATDIAFSLGILALMGGRVPQSLKIFVAAYAVADDIISVLTLAIFYPRDFSLAWLAACVVAIAAIYALNRGRVYAIWPYVLVTIALWFFLHSAGVHAALAGIVLAAFVPTRPTPDAAPLLAQAATALAALENAQREEGGEATDPVLEWASRNLSAASERLLSPADRMEQAIGPWSTYLALPLFAFSATGVRLDADLSAPGAAMVLAGVVAGLVVGKPLGICLAALAAAKSGIAKMPENAPWIGFVAAACLCGIGDTVSLLLADQAFPHGGAVVEAAKIGVLIGSVVAAGLGATVMFAGTRRPGVLRKES